MSGEGVQTSRVQALLPYIFYLTSRQIPFRQLLVRHGLHRYDLNSPLAHMPTMKLLAFTQDVAAVLDDHQIGLRIARCSKPEDLLCIGLFMSYASTVREALSLTVDSIGASQNCAAHSMVPVEGGSAFVFRYECSDANLSRYEMERWAATIVKLIRFRLGETWSPVEIHFEHSLKGRLPTYEQFFGAPIFFDCPVNQIIFRSEDLDLEDRAQPNVLTSYIREHFFGEYVTYLRGDMDRPRTLSGRVGLAVSQRLGEADCTLPAVASELNMSARSLQRHLATEGTSFQDIVRQQRHHIAMTLINGDKRATTAAIAASVGYSDRTTLSKAFKSWTGSSPKSYSNAIGPGHDAGFEGDAIGMVPAPRKRRQAMI